MGSPVDESGFPALLEEEIRTARIDQFTCNGAELRALRADVATGLQLDPEAQAALELLAADDQ